MNDTALRHIIAFVFTLITLMAFWSGYISGGHGWWWVAFGCLIIYGGVYKFVDAGGHGGGGKHH
jgi:hypothetical protein